MTYASNPLGSVTYGGREGWERVVMKPSAMNLDIEIGLPTIISDILILPPAMSLNIEGVVPNILTQLFNLSMVSGYTTDSVWKHLAFDVSKAGYNSQIDLIEVDTEQMASGARCNFTLTYNKGKNTLDLGSIAYSITNKIRHTLLRKGPRVDDFRLDWNFSEGSTINPVKIRSITVKGHYIKSS